MARRLKHWIKAYLRYTRFSEAPEEFHLWTAVSTIAGALRRKVYFPQPHYQWSTNNYVIFVAPPGVATKSTAMRQGMEMLEEIGVSMGPNSLTWQVLPTALADARIDWPMPGPILERSHYPMCCLTFASSELGNLINPEDRSMIDLLVDLWDGNSGAWRKVTKTQGSDDVVNPWINIIACTTPSWLSSYLPKKTIEGGFISRCIFVHATKKRQYVAYPSRLMNGYDATQDREDLIHDLQEIARMVGEYRLTPNAEDWGTTWYQGLESRYEKVDNDVTGNFLARLQCHCHKLAMVIAASQRTEMVITREDLETATTIVSALEPNTQTVFRASETAPEQVGADRVVSFVKKNKVVARSLLQRQFWHMLSGEKFDAALNGAIHAGFLQQESLNGKLMIRWTGDD